jgi:hypothetical protein
MIIKKNDEEISIDFEGIELFLKQENNFSVFDFKGIENLDVKNFIAIGVNTKIFGSIWNKWDGIDYRYICDAKLDNPNIHIFYDPTIHLITQIDITKN